MERFILELDKATAKKWKYTSIQGKERISEEIYRILKVAVNKEGDDLWPFLKRLRKKAEKKGFNDDILNQILSEK